MTGHDVAERGDEEDQLDSVAVVGMAGRVAGAPDLDTFWANLEAGHCAVRPLTDEELAAVDPVLRADPDFVPVAADVADVAMWDAGFFGFSPRVAEVTDPQHRVFLECAWQALEHAGYDPLGTPGVVGVIAGTGFPTYLQNNILGNWDVIAEAGHMQLAIGNDRDSLSTMVAYKLNLRGPSFTIQTACSTSMLAVHLACNSLLTFESDVMLAGGVAIQTPQAGGYLYEEGGILAPDGVIRCLDAKARGGVFGNGAGAVVLKRTADALRDGDRIYAQILGSATNNDGISRAGFAAPGLRGQSEVITEALGNAGISPDTVSYVEAHGTGTVLGDAIEMDAVSRGFLPRDPAARACVIGSAKANVGHTDRASGVLGLIKTCLMLHHRRIPPQINFESPNTNLDVSGGAFRVVTEGEDWPAESGPRRALVNSFGMGGTNAVAVLEEAPPRDERAETVATPQMLVLAARSPEALDEATGALRDHLVDHPEANLADVAFTLQTGRTGFNHRRALACVNRLEAISGLSHPDSAWVRTLHQTRRHRRVVLAVPDDELAATELERQVGPLLYAAEPEFRAALDRCAEALGLTGEQRWQAPAAGAAIRYALAELLRANGLRAHRFVGASRGGTRADGVPSGAAVAECLAGTRPLAKLTVDTVDRHTELAELAELAVDEDVVLVELGDGRLLRALDTGQTLAEDGSRLAVFAEPFAVALTAERMRVAVRDLVARSWLGGADPDWAVAHAGREPRRAALPTYPFERRRLWLDPSPTGLVRPTTPQRTDNIDDWFYAPVWRQAPRVAPADLDNALVAAGPWLVVGTEPTAGLAEILRDRLHRAGAPVELVLDAEDTGRLVGDVYPRTVLHTGAAEKLADPVARSADAGLGRAALRDFDQAQQGGFESVRRLVGDLLGRPSAAPPRLVMLTRGAVRVLRAEPLRPAHAGLIGLARVVPQENPGFRCQVVDLGPVAEDAELVDAVLAEAIGDEATTVAFRDGRRWQEDHEPMPLPAPAAGPPVREGGTYLITGGFGQVCLALAEHLAAHYRARLALLARPALPPETDWDDWLSAHPDTDRASRRILAVRRLRAAGAEVLVVTADVADADQVAAAVAEVRAAFGEPDGVIHGAGVQAEDYFGLTHELSPDQCREHYRAKLFGLAALAEAIDLARLDFCVTLSSLATVLGAIGHAPYAAANAAMDSLAQALFDAGGRAMLTVDWDSWPSGTSVPELGAATTVANYRMSYPEGISALERSLSAVGSVPRLVNSTGDLAPRLAAWVDAKDGADAAGDGERHPRPPLDTPLVPPAGEVERTIAELWQEILGLDEIGVLDNFFDLGGHSLMAVRLIGRLRKSVGLNVPIAVLAECPTVRELAERITVLGSSPAEMQRRE
jgi:acyl transferase domain-containing protein/acyl carrier protein